MAEQAPEPIRLALIEGAAVDASRMHPLRAGEMARHIKAALLHLHAAERIAEGADIEVVPALRDERSPGHLFYNADATLQELDAWAIQTAYANNVAGVYDGTEHWCHAPGGTLPTAGLRI